MKIISIDAFEGFSGGSHVCVWVHLKCDAVDAIATAAIAKC